MGARETVSAPEGTVVRVENLFSIVPARLKFLKKDATERRQINALVTRYAMAYPHVRFHLRQENRITLQTSGNGDLREVLAGLYGPDAARQMLEVLADEDEVNLSGFISPTGLTRASRREITFFVNGRWVQDYTLTSALVQAYHTMLMVGRFPMAVIFLKIEPQWVDVNVHPAKAEVRFQHRDLIFRAVRREPAVPYWPMPLFPTWTLMHLPAGCLQIRISLSVGKRVRPGKCPWQLLMSHCLGKNQKKLSQAYHAAGFHFCVSLGR